MKASDARRATKRAKAKISAGKRQEAIQKNIQAKKDAEQGRKDAKYTYATIESKIKEAIEEGKSELTYETQGEQSRGWYGSWSPYATAKAEKLVKLLKADGYKVEMQAKSFPIDYDNDSCPTAYSYYHEFKISWKG